jgi:tetratricopeptide (TPR) repeat protein
MSKKGNWEGAIAAYRKCIALDRKYRDRPVHYNYRDGPVHYSLGYALQQIGDLDGAIAAYREAIRLVKDFAEAHCNLGGALKRKGEFRKALEEFRRGHALGSKQANWGYPSADWVREAEQLVALDAKLPDVLNGEVLPADAAEWLGLAKLCQHHKKLYAASARFYRGAFDGESKLIGANRYDAACVAALAGCGMGKDADNLDEKERSRLRRQALDWLRADLEANRLALEKGEKDAGPTVAGSMRHWLADADFAGVRGADALAKLPDAERQQWQRLWNDVGDMLKRAQEKADPDKK